MRIAVLAVVAMLFGGGTAMSADPAIVFQTQPVGQVLNDIREGANLLGGDNGTKALNKEIKARLGDKGFEGLDVGQPIFGYVLLAPKPEDITAVVALPVTNEKAFLDLCERANHQTPKLVGKEKGLYELPPLDPRYKALLRFSDRYAYIAYGARPAPAIDPKALIPLRQIYNPAERGLIAGRLYFDRIPPEVKLALPVLMKEIKKTVLGALNLGRDEEPFAKAITPEIEKLFIRYATLAAGADELSTRISVDAPSGNLIVEATLNGKPGSELSKIIAGRKPTTNKFGGLLVAPDTVAGFKVRLPLFEEEIRTAAVAGLNIGQKEAVQSTPEISKVFVEELFKGLIRTVKTGEFDLAIAVRGPDKNDWYSVVGAVAFEDTTALEKEFRSIQKAAPADVRDDVNLDVAKVGNINIHTWKLKPGGFLDVTKVLGGDNCQVAFAFAPHGVFAVVGPDSVNSLKSALAIPVAESPVLDVVMNPVRVTNLISKISPNFPGHARLERILGKDDKLLSAMSMTVVGGNELTVTYKIDLRLIPRAALSDDIDREKSAPGEKP
jgi:hypothetical protein